MNKPLNNVLFIGKDKGEYNNFPGIYSFIKQQKINVTFGLEIADTEALLLESVCDVALLDFEIAGLETFEILQKTLQQRPHKCIIILADKSNKKHYSKAMKLGAYDFLIKQDIDLNLLEKSVRYSFSHSKILSELRESESKFKDLVEHLPAMFYISHIHPPYSQIYASPSFKVFGYQLEEWLGVKNMWSDVIHPDDKEWVLAETDRAMNLGEETDYEYRIIGKNDQVFWVHDRGHYYYAADGETVYWQGLMNDITDRKVVQQQLLHKLKYDDLTGLRNRSSFVEKLKFYLNRFQNNNSVPFAVFLMDLDRFKTINDNLGHLVGDKFLIEISRRIEKIVGKAGIVSRLSGDEFAILIEDASDLREVEKIAREICEAIAMPTFLDGFEFKGSASVGITISDKSHQTNSDVLRNADAAMYHAKQSGRNCCKFYDENLYQRNLRFHGIENELRFALERNEFSLVYQPIVNLKTGEIEQIECLIRWNNNKYGKIEPTEFIPIAEGNGMIVKIGEWVLEQSFKQLSKWQKSIFGQNSLMMSVNISPKQIVNHQFVEKIEQYLKNNNLSPRNICLEITENSLVDNGEYVLERIKLLNQMGFQISTDDFGTGYSSLSYLHKFPLNELKIDKSFICSMDKDYKIRKIVRTIIALAKSLELKIVAEGVESGNQLENLIELGCDLAQGYFISKPLDEDSVEKILIGKLPLPLLNSFQDKIPTFETDAYGMVS